MLGLKNMINLSLWTLKQNPEKSLHVQINTMCHVTVNDLFNFACTFCILRGKY